MKHDIRIYLINEVYGTHLIPDKDEPMGWENIDITYRRDDRFHGVFPAITAPLKWLCSGYVFIKNCYQQFGIDADIQVYIQGVCDNKTYEVFNGKLDLSTAVFTTEFVECEIKPYNCLDIFLNRLDIPVNLYDEPCFTELTYDKTAYRYRYLHAPYRVEFVEKQILAKVEWTMGYDAPVEVENKFSIDSDSGKLVISIDPQDPAYIAYCGNTDPALNGTYPIYSQFTNSSGDAIYKIVNGVPAQASIDDINFINSGFFPQTGAEQYHRNSSNLFLPEQPWDPLTQYNGSIGVCSCCGSANPNVKCEDYVFYVDVAADMNVCLDIQEGEFNFFAYQHELVFQFGDYEQILQINPVVVETNGCVPWDDTDDCSTSSSSCTGSPACLFFTGQVVVPACDVPNEGKFRIITRTTVGFKGGGVLLNGADCSVVVQTSWLKNNGRLETVDCIPDAQRVGTTFPNCFAVHESFSRIAEYYTNNCLKVKSSYFGRPNSMTGADNEEYQCPTECGCCESKYDLTPDAWNAVAIISHVPPALPDPPAVDNVVVDPLIVGSFSSNGCSLVENEGCLEFTVPGVYDIVIDLALDVDMLVGWTNADTAIGSAQIDVDLQIGTSVYSYLSETIVSPVMLPACDTDSVSSTNAGSPISVQVIITQDDIDAGDNKICATARLQANAGTILSCDANPADLQSEAILGILAGANIYVTNAECESAGDKPGYDPDIPCVTFDPAPYQVAEKNTTCAAWTVISSGLNIREFGTACYTTFNELFDAMNAIYNIGVGYSDADPDNLYVEYYEYFYQENVIIELGEVDTYQAKEQISIATDYYFNLYNGGYTEWLQDIVSTIDEFNTSRAYKLPIKNTESQFERICRYNASGYSIEWQRRQIYTTDSSYDSDIFVICVGRSTDIMNEGTMYQPPLAPLLIPNHMYRVETGVSFAMELIDPESVYNWRIRPLAMALYHANQLSMPLWALDSAAEIDFQKGETNYICSGDDIQSGFCSSPASGKENQNIVKQEAGIYPIFPEYVKLVYPLTVSQFHLIRNNPYSQIAYNGERYWLKELKFRPSENSELTLIKSTRNPFVGP